MKKSSKIMKNNTKTDFNNFKRIFLEENSKHNLISKGDEKFLYEKHYYDSVSLKLFFDKYKISGGKILDIGCGGGFPCIPLAIEFPEYDITGLDSIRKKINSVNTMKESLGLNNLSLICERVEKLDKKEKYDIIVSRAVGELKKICNYALPLLKKGGYFVAYKSKKVQEEIDNSKDILKKFKAEVIDIIKYNLPLEDTYERNLVIIKL
ncbi:16S rRNA (guanine(527)-N(7))-methyltransferase RsmG [bacterium]|nr:16S rRNA (guanine(527)-N(7))-methyltransferase RsmG [bacterium]